MKNYTRLTRDELIAMANNLMANHETVAVNAWLAKKTQTFKDGWKIKWFCNEIMMITHGAEIWSR